MHSDSKCRNGDWYGIIAERSSVSNILDYELFIARKSVRVHIANGFKMRTVKHGNAIPISARNKTATGCNSLIS